MVRRLIRRITNLFKTSPAPRASTPAPSPKAKSEPASTPSPGSRTPHKPRVTGARSTTPSPAQGVVVHKPKAPWSLADFVVSPAEGKTRFHDFPIPESIMHAIDDLNFKYCTPIQAQALNLAFEGHDIAGQAQTGTGKTAVFLITIMTRILKDPIPSSRPSGTPQALILAPTRELALQIGKDAMALGRYTGLRTMVVFGGMDYQKQQRDLLAAPVDILVATPGRLLDFVSQHKIHLKSARMLVIDEADRMLDMGFIPDVRRIIHALPPRQERQTFLFSATLSPDIYRLAGQWMTEPIRIDVEPEKLTLDLVDQQVFLVSSRQKFAFIYNTLVHEKPKRVLIFANRRDDSRRLADHLNAAGVHCALLTGEVAQNQRLKILEDFREGRIKVLVATDVAGRGIHVDAISHVINFDIPMDPEDYVHRIGRTGRAGATGKALTLACENESFDLPPIEKLIGRSLACQVPDEQRLHLPPEVAAALHKTRHQDAGEQQRNRRPPPTRYSSSSRHRSRR